MKKKPDTTTEDLAQPVNKPVRTHTLGELRWYAVGALSGDDLTLVQGPRHVDTLAAKKWLRDELSAERLAPGTYQLVREVERVTAKVETQTRIVMG